MLLGLYHHIQQQDYSQSFWELVGIRKSNWLQDYIASKYGVENLQHTQGSHHQLIIEHSLQQGIIAGNQQSLTELLQLSRSGISDALKLYLKSKKFPYQKVAKRIASLHELVNELEIPLPDLMKQFATIKDQFSIKLHDIDLDFLLHEDVDTNLNAMMQQMI